MTNCSVFKEVVFLCFVSEHKALNSSVEDHCVVKYLSCATIGIVVTFLGLCKFFYENSDIFSTIQYACAVSMLASILFVLIAIQ